MSDMSNTPRTEKFMLSLPDNFATKYEAMFGFACQLEQELAAMTAAKNKAVEALKRTLYALEAIKDDPTIEPFFTEAIQRLSELEEAK